MRASPAQNLRNALEALDEMIEEADRKVEKKYRPNMFGEFKQLNDTEGKVREGADALIEVGKARSVPSLQVDTLEGKQVDIQSFVTKGKATLVLTAFKNYGLDMLPAWREGFVAAMSDGQGQLDKRVQTLTLNVIEDWYMKLVSGSITRGLQEKIPNELHATTFAHFGRCDDFRTPMELDNSFVGYAHLVDGKGRIRWMYVVLFVLGGLVCGVVDLCVGLCVFCSAGGPATPKELERLAKVTKELLAQSSQRRR